MIIIYLPLLVLLFLLQDKMSTVLSLYIPVIQENITEAYIKRQFLDHNIGKILRVDFVKNISKGRREAFVHFDEWFDNPTSRALQEDIKNPDTQTRFVYMGNKFFPLLVNKNAHKRVNNPDYEPLKESPSVILSIPIMKPKYEDNYSSKKQQM